MKKSTGLIILFFMLFTVSGCSGANQAESPVRQNFGQTTAETPVKPSSDKIMTEPALEEQSPADFPAAHVDVAPAETIASQPETLPVAPKSWYFKPNQDHSTPQIDAAVQQLATEAVFYYALPQNAPHVYLTFDEGYEQGYSGQILDTLKQYQVPAVFFITGHYLASQPDLVKRMAAECHQVANHTYNHLDLAQVSQKRFNKELDQLEQEFEALTHSSMAPFLRPPMGNYSLASLQWAKDNGYTTVFWSMAFRDWDPNDQPGADFSHRYIMDHIHPGAIILLHAVSESNTQALPQIIEDVRKAGYEFAPLPQ